MTDIEVHVKLTKGAVRVRDVSSVVQPRMNVIYGNLYLQVGVFNLLGVHPTHEE